MAFSDTWLKANNGKERAALEERGDRGGLGVRITPKGKITFQLRYRYQGAARRLDLGSYPLMSLKEARSEAQRLRAQHEQGHDPQVVRLLEKQAIVKANSVESLFRQWHEAYCQKNKKGAYEIRLARYRDRPTGLAAFLGRVTGIDRIRNILHRRDDTKRLNAYGEALQVLKGQQAVDAKTQEARLKLQTQELSRKQAALEKIDKRELAAFMRDQRTAQRVRSRDGGDAMPSLTVLVYDNRAIETPVPDVLSSFENARQQQHEEMPDLMSAFKRAAKPDAGREQESGGVGLERARPPDHSSPEGPEPGRGRGRSRASTSVGTGHR